MPGPPYWSGAASAETRPRLISNPDVWHRLSGLLAPHRKSPRPRHEGHRSCCRANRLHAGTSRVLFCLAGWDAAAHGHVEPRPHGARSRLLRPFASGGRSAIHRAHRWVRPPRSGFVRNLDNWGRIRRIGRRRDRRLLCFATISLRAYLCSSTIAVGQFVPDPGVEAGLSRRLV